MQKSNTGNMELKILCLVALLGFCCTIHTTPPTLSPAVPPPPSPPDPDESSNEASGYLDENCHLVKA